MRVNKNDIFQNYDHQNVKIFIYLFIFPYSNHSFYCKVGGYAFLEVNKAAIFYFRKLNMTNIPDGYGVHLSLLLLGWA